MTDRRRLIIGGAILVAAFLVGFVPQYREAGRLRGELGAARQEIDSLQWKIRLAGLRDLIGLVYMEANQKNYGLARQHLTQFFARTQELAGEATDADLKSLLESALQQRDDITAGLAKGEGAARDQVEKLYKTIHEGTQ
jgi:hypothetical protein